MTAPDPRLDEIQARLSAATPGPWFQGREGKRYEDTRDVYTEREVSATSRDIGRIDYPEDAALIANAPTDVAFLLAELRKAREALERVDEVAVRLNWEADNANEGAKYAAEVNQGASLMALESERFAYQKAEHLIRAAVAAAKGDERG